MPPIRKKKKVKKPAVLKKSPPFRLSSEQWLAISLSLEEKHSIFYRLWNMGSPIFTDSIETACVQFNPVGECVAFMFNPDFWNECSEYKRRFVICHEALHVIFNHGKRIGTTDNPEICNAMLDVVVNHTLTNKFGFERDKIEGWEKLCWVDTVFKGKDGKIRKDHRGKDIPENECFEYYMGLLDRVNTPMLRMGGKGATKDAKGFGTLDDHTKMDGKSFDEVIRRLARQMPDHEKKDVQGMIEKHSPPDDDSNFEVIAGEGTGGLWEFVNTKPKPKKKWETVITEWAKVFLRRSTKDKEQWARLNRRFTALPQDMFLPTEMEIDTTAGEKSKIEVYFYLDTSGSCWHLKDRFFQAAESLPKDRFDVRLFCFDTTVQETDLQSKRVYGGGGTRFDIIESSIQQEMTLLGKPEFYPKAVFVITDGVGCRVTPKYPDRWRVFLSPPGRRTDFPKECKFYKLEDFE